MVERASSSFLYGDKRVIVIMSVCFADASVQSRLDESCKSKKIWMIEVVKVWYKCFAVSGRKKKDMSIENC